MVPVMRQPAKLRWLLLLREADQSEEQKSEIRRALERAFGGTNGTINVLNLLDEAQTPEGVEVLREWLATAIGREEGGEGSRPDWLPPDFEEVEEEHDPLPPLDMLPWLKRKLPRGKDKAAVLPTLRFSDFADIDDGCGFSVYRDILVFWDDDHDGRIFDALDNMDPVCRSYLIAVRERKAQLYFLWDGREPHGFEGLRSFLLPGDGDTFNTGASFILKNDGNNNCPTRHAQ